MSQENVEVVRNVFAAHRNHGIEAALPFLCADVVWDPGPDWIEDDAYRGRDGVRKLDAVWANNFDDYSLELHELRDLDDRVLGFYEMVGRIKDSDQEVRQPLGIIVSDFRDGMIGGVRSFRSWQLALEAVGLTE
jgi:ketosteroid isomerase-like protein